jgi:hypothetical protein
MTRDPRRLIPGLLALGLLALAGCRSDKDSGGSGGVGMGASRPRDKDPLVVGPSKIPKQDLPVPDRLTGPKGSKPDPLMSPTGSKTGYTDDPERFKGVFLPGKGSTPAALAARSKDADELRIDDGAPLVPAGGVLPGGTLEAAEGVSPLYGQLERYGVTPDDRTLARENERYVFRASVPISGNGAKRQYTGIADTAPEAVRKVLDQVAADQKK